MIQKQVGRSANGGTPWLEFFPAEGGPVQKTLLATMPFSIGRNDTTDLPINSTRVSREHAVIDRVNDGYCLRDLDSTNGTFVNGERIDEVRLNDGDILMIADVEFTFFTGQAQTSRKTVTQVIDSADSDAKNLKTADLIRCVRRMQESLLHGGMASLYHGIYEFETSRLLAIQASPPTCQTSGSYAQAERFILASHTRLSNRLKESVFVHAAHDLALLPDEPKLFMLVESGEIDKNFVFDVLDRLQNYLPTERLVLELPDSAVNDIPYFRDLHGLVRDLGARVCYGGFAGGKAQLDVYRKFAPDFVKLSPTFLKGRGGDSSRSSAMETVLAAARELRFEIIATGVDTPEIVRQYQDLGCSYGTGSVFGGPHQTPQPLLHAAAEPERPARSSKAPVAAGHR